MYLNIQIHSYQNISKKIEKLEYVDFEELLPSLPSAARFGNEPTLPTYMQATLHF